MGAFPHLPVWPTIYCRVWATPIDSKLSSPAELLLGRQVQDNLHRKIQNDHSHDEVIGRLQERQVQQKYYLISTPLPYPAWFQDSKWPFRIPRHWNGSQLWYWIKPVVHSRSYIVSTLSGKELRRNHSHIRQAPPPSLKQASLTLTLHLHKLSREKNS